MKKTAIILLMFLCGLNSWAQEKYVPSPENLEARKQFQDNKFGI